MKSPAMAQALAPIERLEGARGAGLQRAGGAATGRALAAKLRADEKVKLARKQLKGDPGADVAALLRAADDEDEVLERARYVVNDLTYEALGAILHANPLGVLAVRDEIKGLLTHLSREENAQARGFFLQAWSGGPYTFDRIGRGTVTVADARLSIIGGIQPGPLAELVRQARSGTADDGMIERFLIAWPDAPADWREVDRWPESTAKRIAWEAFDRLDGLTPDVLRAERDTDPHGEARGVPFLRFADDAREAFAEWHAECAHKLKAAESEGLEGALSKYRHHVPALALALHVIDGGAGPVALAPTLRALRLAEYFEGHTRRLHGSSRRLAVRGARSILNKARSGELPDPFTAREVHQPGWSGLTDRATVADALDMLAAHGWLTEATVETGGRPKVLFALAEGARLWVSGRRGWPHTGRRETAVPFRGFSPPKPSKGVVKL